MQICSFFSDRAESLFRFPFLTFGGLLLVCFLPDLQENLCLDDQEKLAQEYPRLHQAMEMVGFLASTKKLYVFHIPDRGTERSRKSVSVFTGVFFEQRFLFLFWNLLTLVSEM